MVDQPGRGAVSAGGAAEPTAARGAQGAGTAQVEGRVAGTPASRWAFWSRWRRDRSRPLPPIRPWPRRQWPLLVVLVGVFVSLVVVVLVDFRPGTVLLAGSVLLAAAFRLVLTTRRAGLLVVRSRMVDVMTLTIMGVATLLLALAVPDIR
ncbi:DUF3017 domain-containing protein [Actinopolymorpha alba]|uniref:DUF3017 domain-containing protein n=1 Tax=Actinopolymorpha alba TaxID=533267 RepID=UPI0003702E7F|nr:DUF3017 domain-containing protein [Actinopolymorpha alba]